MKHVPVNAGLVHDAWQRILDREEYPSVEAVCSELSTRCSKCDIDRYLNDLRANALDSGAIFVGLSEELVVTINQLISNLRQAAWPSAGEERQLIVEHMNSLRQRLRQATVRWMPEIDETASTSEQLWLLRQALQHEWFSSLKVEILNSRFLLRGRRLRAQLLECEAQLDVEIGVRHRTVAMWLEYKQTLEDHLEVLEQRHLQEVTDLNLQIQALSTELSETQHALSLERQRSDLASDR